MELFESGLFMELGEVVGHDPNLYEDIPKQQTLNTLSSTDMLFPDDLLEEKSGFGEKKYLCGSSSHDYNHNELDSLLAEGNQLIDQLMAANGLDLSSDHINLADIDELDFATKLATTVGDDDYLFEQHDLLSDLHTLPLSSSVEEDYPLINSPHSSISTLASEPSSPIDISAMQLHYEEQQQLSDLQPVVHSEQESDLNNLLQSLVDETLCESMEYNDHAVYHYQSYELLNTNMTLTDSLSPLTDDSDSSMLSYTSSLSSPVSSPADESVKLKSKKKKKSTPYSKLPAIRKERKKQQNKEAAIRYREKKRNEAQDVLGEEAQLTKRNTELKTEVLNLEREILCMKELLSDVFNIHSL